MQARICSREDDVNLADFDMQVIWRPEGRVQSLIIRLCQLRNSGRIVFWEDEDEQGRFFEVWVKEI